MADSGGGGLPPASAGIKFNRELVQGIIDDLQKGLSDLTGEGTQGGYPDFRRRAHLTPAELGNYPAVVGSYPAVGGSTMSGLGDGLNATCGNAYEQIGLAYGGHPTQRSRSGPVQFDGLLGALQQLITAVDQVIKNHDRAESVTKQNVANL